MNEEKQWTGKFSYSAGRRPYKVRVFTYTPTGNIFIVMRDKSKKSGVREESLWHRDREAAKAYARKISREWEEKATSTFVITPTLGKLLDEYAKFATPAKVESEQEADARRASMWLKLWGKNRDVRTLDVTDWDQFIEVRRSGAIDAFGNEVTPEKRKGVGNSTIAADLVHVLTVLNFATKRKINGTKEFLLDKNPLRGLKLPEQKNPKRPYATADRYEAIIAVADQVHPYLRPILTIVAGTGRRISAVLSLRFEDLVLTKTANAPNGGIRWPADSDKMGKEWYAPLKASVRGVVDEIMADRPGVGTAPLFPSPDNPSVPISRYRADRWLILAEGKAGVSKQRGGLWHPYRRAWATSRKDLNPKDVAAAGGWSDPSTLAIYQQVDPESLLAVVEGDRELRERKA